jgi:hypothetical protein
MRKIACTVALFCAFAARSSAGPGTVARTYNDPPNQANDLFGSAVAGTGNNLLVGAPGVGNTGAVYSFVQSSNAVQSTLLVPTGMTGVSFGSAIASTSSKVIVGDPDALVAPQPETVYTGAAVVYQSVTDVSPLIVRNPLKATSDRFGAAVAISSAGFVVGAPDLTTGSVTKAGAAYIYTNGNASPVWSLENPSPGTETGFGTSVAYSEDALVAVGAPGATTSTMLGSVSLYNAGTGALVGNIVNPGVGGELFGYSLANVGGSIIVGAPAAGSGTGRVYVYDRATRILQWTLSDPTPTAGEQFGYAVSGVDHYVIVGAPDDNTSAAKAGSIFVFDANTGSLVLSVANPQPSTNDSFGKSVAGIGTNILVGDPTSSAAGGASNAGQAFLVGGPNSTSAPPADPSGLAAVTISSTQIRINFTDNSNNEQGFIVERRLESGGSFTEVTTLAENVTEYLDSGLAPTTGYCYRVKAFNADGESQYTSEACATTFAGIIPELIDRLPNPGGEGDLFGYSISALGKTLLAPSCVVIGAPGNDNGGTSAGIAYIFDRSSKFPLVTLANPHPAGAPEFGTAVAALGKYIFVGAPNDDADGADAGIVYMFDGETGILLHTFHSPEPHAGDHFGASVAAQGKTQVIIGAPGRSVEASNSGAAFVFSALSAAHLRTILNPTPFAGDRFGAAVAGLKGSIGVVAPNSNGSSAGSGELYGFATNNAVKSYFSNASSVANAGGKSLGGASQFASNGPGFAYLFSGKKAKVIYPNPSPDAGDSFGASVAGAKKLVVVGAPLDDSTGPDAGEAYLFTQKLPFVLRAYINPAPNQGDHFGHAVAIASPVAYIGAPYDDTDGDDAGSVYMYNAPLK